MSLSTDFQTLVSQHRAELERRVRSSKTAKRDSLRAEIVLLRGDNVNQRDVAKRLGVSHTTVSKWTARFEAESLDGLVDAPGRGRKPSIEPAKLQKAVECAGHPPDGAARWSTRTMAAFLGVSHMTVQRIWSRNDIKPHLTKTFKLSNDPNFEEKFWDVIGLYINPPENAIVLCCDEKSQCQALERTQPGLPLGIGHIKTKTHDYIRHGTATLFAALNHLEGTLISRIETKHTQVEWLRFLKQIERESPQDVNIHIIADNYSTHKTEKVRKWLDAHPRMKMHFTPTGSSWMNMVERFFADITNDCIRDGSFTSVAELARSIKKYIARRNARPKPYVWKAEGRIILEKIARARAAQAAG